MPFSFSFPWIAVGSNLFLQVILLLYFAPVAVPCDFWMVLWCRLLLIHRSTRFELNNFSFNEFFINICRPNTWADPICLSLCSYCMYVWIIVFLYFLFFIHSLWMIIPRILFSCKNLTVWLCKHNEVGTNTLHTRWYCCFLSDVLNMKMCFYSFDG